jgi:hypothetical protein
MLRLENGCNQCNAVGTSLFPIRDCHLEIERMRLRQPERTVAFLPLSKMGLTIQIAACCLSLLLAVQAAEAGMLRVGAYNTFNNPDDVTEDAWFSTIFEAIGNEVINGTAKRLDVLVVSETDTGSSTRLASVLNSLYSISSYSVVTSSSVGGDRTGLVYDASTVTLLGSADLAGIGTHPIVRGQFRPVGTGGNTDFYLYAVHLKSGSSGSDKAARATEAANLRANADALGEGINIIYAGDFNMLGSSEGAWSNMLAAGNGQAFDAADAPGEWRDDAAFLDLHTQNPRSDMNDRFDLQFFTDELLDGTGLDYVADSFHVFANNGTHTLGAAIDTGTGASSTVLSALISAGDHLPIVADYLIPEPDCLTVLWFGTWALLACRTRSSP